MQQKGWETVDSFNQWSFTTETPVIRTTTVNGAMQEVRLAPSSFLLELILVL
jgi:hypothetical protein